MKFRFRNRVHYTFSVQVLSPAEEVNLARSLRLNEQVEVITCGIHKGVPVVALKDSKSTYLVEVDPSKVLKSKAKRGRGILPSRMYINISRQDIANGKIVCVRKTRSGGPKEKVGKS